LNDVIRRYGSTTLFVTYPLLERSVQLLPANESLVEFDTHYGEIAGAVSGDKYRLIVSVAVL